MKQPRFSVIVPAHNAAKFIRKGLDSIRHQTFENYELIIVCDACSDNTAQIAQDYDATVIETNAASPGYARNAGLDIAKGEWILFLDSDDWFLHEFVFQILNDTVGKKNEDVLLISFVWKGVGYTVQHLDHYFNAVWGKIWRRSAIGNIRFNCERVGEDGTFTEDVLRSGAMFAAADIPVVYYNYMRHGSVMWHHNHGLFR